MLKFPYQSSKAKFGLLTRKVPLGAYFALQIGYYTAKIHGCDQNRTALKCAKNHVNWFGRFEAGGSQMCCPRFWDHPVGYTVVDTKKL